MVETKKWTHAGEEPRLDEVMNDPIVHLVMARDNLKIDDVWQVVKNAQKTDRQCAA